MTAPWLLRVPCSLRLHQSTWGESPITTPSANTRPLQGTEKRARAVFPLK